MKKFLMIFLPICIIAVILIVLFIINNNSKPVETSATEKEPVQLTAKDVVLKLKEKNENVGDYIIYTEETDRLKLLGRPNQYTSKVIFEDTRLEQLYKTLQDKSFDENMTLEPTGGIIEVFSNSQDMENRKKYLNSLSSSISMFAEYSYANNYILLRINNELTPTQAKEYEDILNNIFE